MNSVIGTMNTPARVARVESFDVTLKLLPVESTHRVVVEMSEHISINPQTWLDLLDRVLDRYKEQTNSRSLPDLGYADFIREEIQKGLLCCEVLFHDEENKENIDIAIGGLLVVKYIEEEDCLEFYELQSD